MRSRNDALWSAALVALVILTFSDLLVLGRFLYFRDIVRLFVPIRVLVRQALTSHQLPLWNPSWGGGQPLAANPLFEAFYPVQLLTLLSSNAAYGYGIEFVIHIAIAAVGMFFFLRSLELRPHAAAFGAISFALGGTALSLSNLPTMLAALAWLPLVALFGRRFLRDPNARDFALTALVLGMILLTGEQSLTLQAGGLLGAYALTRNRRSRALLLVAVLVIAAVLVGAAQIIPALDHARDSGRGSSIAYHASTNWSYPPPRIVELAFPTLFATYGVAIYDWSSDRFHPGFSSPLILSTYFGLLGCVLVIAAFIRRLRGYRFAAAIASIGFVLGFGRNTPLGPLLYSLLYRFIRYPEKWVVSSIFVLITLAAIAADRLDSDDALARTAKRVAVAVAAIALLLAATAFLPQFPDLFARVWRKSGYIGDYLAEYRRGALTTAAMTTTLALLFAIRQRVSRSVWLASLGVFVLLDLGIRVGPLTPTVGADYYEPPPVTAQLGPPQQVRIYNEADELPKWGGQRSFDQWFVANHDAIFPEIESIWGYGSILGVDVSLTHLKPTIELKNAFRTMQQHNPGGAAFLLVMSGTTQVITASADPRSLEPRVFNVPGQRYYFADEVVRATTAQITTRLLANERFSPHVAFIDETPFPPAPGRVLRSSETMNTIDLDVESAGNAALLIAVTRHKYWYAAIDGAAATLHPANIAFQMLVVPRGRHHIALRYRNPIVSVCLAISILSAAILSVVALRSKARPPQPTH